MLLVKRTFSPKGIGFNLVLNKSFNRTILPLNQKLIYEKSDDVELWKTNCHVQLRGLHLTRVNRDVEIGLKAIGTGLAATGLAGAGIGCGLVFNALLHAAGRNPSVINKLLPGAILGAAFCEAMGLFSLLISFLIMP